MLKFLITGLSLSHRLLSLATLQDIRFPVIKGAWDLLVPAFYSCKTTSEMELEAQCRVFRVVSLLLKPRC